MKLEALPRGSVVLVAFPSTDLTSTKLRPALVISTPDFHKRTKDVLLAAISSVVGRAKSEPTAVLLRTEVPGFAQSGLRVASVVLCGKLVTVQGTLVLKVLGRLTTPLMRPIDDALRRAVGLASAR
jgi:mRNA interferase MazF